MQTFSYENLKTYGWLGNYEPSMRDMSKTEGFTHNKT